MQNTQQKLEEILCGSRLPALDGIRAISVIAVIFSHAGLAPVGGLGVITFFVLSGFLITWLLLKEWNKTGTISFSKFYYRRSLRIFPAYYFFILITVSADLLLGNHEIKPAIIPALTYTTNYFNVFYDHPPLSTAHAWSLAIEEQFYLLWPLLFLACLRVSSSKLWIFVFCLISAVIIWRSTAYTVIGMNVAYVYNSFETRFDSLAIGCLLAVVTQYHHCRLFFAKLSDYVFPSFILLAALIYLHMYGGSLYRYTIGLSISALFVALLLPQLMLQSSKIYWRWLELPAIRHVGIISYAMYLWHGRCIELVHKLGAESAISKTIWGTVVCIIVSSASYFIIEAYFLRLKEKNS